MQEDHFKELLQDETFINYCFRRNEVDVAFWEGEIKRNPEHQQEIEEMRLLVLGLGIRAAEVSANQQYQLLRERINTKPTVAGRPVFRLPIAFKYAAAVLVVISASLALYKITRPGNIDAALTATVQKDIGPGTNKAVLTLSDGKKIALANDATGKIPLQKGLTIIKAGAGKLVYGISAPDQGENTLTTPRGGQYSVTLPDGSRAWLNAASSLTYPVTFTGTERKVTMTGEVYFEIAKDKKHPFNVTAGDQSVQVLGTHFNINAYADEHAITTTLLEGSIRLSSSATARTILMRPGEQVINNGDLALQQANTEEALAWKNGDFNFNNEPLAHIIRKVSRWYDVEIICPENIGNYRFSGIVSRSRNISAVLQMLGSTEKVHVKIEGRRITLMN